MVCRHEVKSPTGDYANEISIWDLKVFLSLFPLVNIKLLNSDMAMILIDNLTRAWFYHRRKEYW